MPRRTVCIQSACRISISLGALRLESQSRDVRIPLEDIWVLILESREALLSSWALSELMEAGVPVITCDGKHMPNGLSLALGAHSRHAAIVKYQLSASLPLRKRLWQSIVKAKILNQSRVLEGFGLDTAYLNQCARETRSGDTTNREAVAAQAYFKALLPDGKRRDGVYTAALDYGYALLRASIARCLVAGGWLVSQGIHHDSSLNSFNLADDLIEPFRPLIDFLVCSNRISEILDSKAKQQLLSIFEYTVESNGRSLGIQGAIEETIDSLKDSILMKDPSLLILPRIDGLNPLPLE